MFSDGVLRKFDLGISCLGQTRPRVNNLISYPLVKMPTELIATEAMMLAYSAND